MSSRIKITFDNNSLTATLNNSPTSKDFIALLPITLTLEDFGTEKASDLPRKLSVESAAEGYVPLPGDITYFAPWRNIAIFYDDFRYVRDLIMLGKIEGNMGSFKGAKSIVVHIVLIENEINSGE